jgi:hypothetical protein
MAKKQPFALVYAPEVKHHLLAIDRQHHSSIRETLQDQLLYEPDTETRNRKPLQHPAVFEAQWELRFGHENRIRVFYEADRKNREVHILAIGVKQRERLLIGGEEVEL